MSQHLFPPSQDRKGLPDPIPGPPTKTLGHRSWDSPEEVVRPRDPPPNGAPVNPIDEVKDEVYEDVE